MKQREEYLLLEGGVDIDPSIYGHKRIPHTQHPDRERDAREILAYEKALQKKIPVIGICRGGQLLCALNGGSLWQHSPNHGWSHGLKWKWKDTDGYIETACAGHHQVMNPEGTNHVMIAVSPFITHVVNQEMQMCSIKESPEVIYFPDTKSLAIQPHPEWEEKGSPFKTWVDNLIFDLFGLKGVI